MIYILNIFAIPDILDSLCIIIIFTKLAMYNILAIHDIFTIPVIVDTDAIFVILEIFNPGRLNVTY